MAGSVEINVKQKYIETNVKKLNNIVQNVSNSKIEHTVSQSKGDVANEVNNLITELNQLGTELTELLKVNTKNIEDISVKFTQTDNKVAEAYKS